MAYPVCVSTREGGVVEVVKENQAFKSRYERVLPESTSQEEMYRCMQVAVDDAFKGYNSTVLAYGQTGTGKTYTVMGAHSIQSSTELANVSDLHGIIPRAVCQVFSRLRGTSGALPKSSTTVIVSYMEIYNDHLYDLLQPYKRHLATRSKQDMHQQKSSLSVQEDGFGQISVQHLISVKVTDVVQVFQLIKKGNDQRSMRQTELNQNSSRGHSILQFLLEQRPPHGAANTVIRSKMNFVDLAGSERYPADDSTRARVAEMNAINVSLSALSSVVSALAGKEKHVPYRDSKLTHLLKDSLGGNCNTYMIATISPSARSFDENVSTLKFADRASSVVNNAVKNVQLDMRNLLEMKDREIDRLRGLVIAFAGRGDEGGDARAAPRSDSAEGQLRTLRGKVEQLQEALDTERRRAQELERQMGSGTVVNAPDVLDADSVRRDASLLGAVGTSGARRGGSRTSTPNTPAPRPAEQPWPRRHMLADDLSAFALGPGPASAYQRPPATVPQLAASSPALPGASAPKRRPKGRAQAKGQLRPSASLDRSPTLGMLPAGLLASAAVKPVLHSKQQHNYQRLLDMYNQLATDVAHLNTGAPPRVAAKRRLPNLERKDSPTEFRAQQPGFPAAHASGQTKMHASVDAAEGGWGLRNVLVSRGAASESMAAHVPTPKPATAAPSSSGFGLKSILRSAPASSTAAVETRKGRIMNVARSRTKNPDVFDAGSWIYIMGRSTSSVRAKEIAACTKKDPRMARVALRSIDMDTLRRV